MEFGKCKGQSLEYAIINNPKYIKELLDGNLIKIDTRSAELLNSKLELIK
jgi:hypothetical protein